MNIIYRFLSLIINIVAILLTISLVFSIRMLFSSPVMMLSAFIMIAVILYSWFSFQFSRLVVQQRQVVKHSLRDWIRVNGIVTLIFSFMTAMSVLQLLQNPQPFIDALKGMGVDTPLKSIKALFYLMLVYAVVLVVHILMTFALMKKHRDFFQ